MPTDTAKRIEKRATKKTAARRRTRTERLALVETTGKKTTGKKAGRPEPGMPETNARLRSRVRRGTRTISRKWRVAPRLLGKAGKGGKK